MSFTKCPACHRTNGDIRIYNYAASGRRFCLKLLHEGEHAYHELEFKADSPTDRAKLVELAQVINRFLAGEYKGS